MKQKICQVCGAEALVLNEWKKEYKCRACDAVFGIEDAFSADAEALNDLQDAERLLQQNPPSFDYAETQFDLIIRKYPTWSAGYWGRLRAKFGIKYEIDYSGKSVPSCYMSTYEDIRENEDFHNALRYASPELKRVYEEQAARIADVARIWRENAEKYNYDVFISFKETDDTTHGVTSDRQEMLELYNHLTMKGYKVFFSPVSLHQRDIYGAQSEPYIFDAIDDAKIMIVYGSKAEYFNSTWVQNEWQRYYLAMSKGKKAPGSLIVAYEGFNAIELPNVLRKTQAVDAHSKHFHSDILDLVEKFCKPEKYKAKQATEPPTTTSKKTKTGAITCPECGGNFSHEDLLDGDKIVTCLTCGKSFLTSDILKEKKDVFARPAKPKREKKPKPELTREERLMAEERAEKFKKRKLSKFIIFSMVVFLIVSVAMFANKNILVGALAAASSVLLLLAYLFGRQVIKVGNHNLHVLPTIVAFLMIIPMVAFGGNGFITGNPEDAIHTYEVRNYIGRNAATIGKVESGYQVDEYGSGKLRLVFVTENGMFLLPSNSEMKKDYVVVAQNIPAATSFNVVHLTDYRGEPYSNLVDYQGFEEIILFVAPIGDTNYSPTYVEPQPAEDRHKFFIREYVGKNAAAFGEYSGDDRIDVYGAANIKLTFSAEDGSYVDSSDINELKKYIVVSQNIAVNSELIVEYEKDYKGEEYDNLIASQNHVEIELTVRKLDDVIISLMPEIQASSSSSSSGEKTELTLKYRVLLNGKAEISGFTGEGNHATIDSKIDGYEVVSIGESAFKDCVTLESITFWADIETIKDYAFSGCTSLTEISVPNETTDIGDYAFYNCTSLAKLTLWGDPDIGDYAFANCTSIKEVSIGYDTKNVGDHAFDGCTSLEKVTVWNDETKFGLYVFDNCPNLQERPPIREE